MAGQRLVDDAHAHGREQVLQVGDGAYVEVGRPEGVAAIVLRLWFRGQYLAPLLSRRFRRRYRRRFDVFRFSSRYLNIAAGRVAQRGVALDLDVELGDAREAQGDAVVGFLYRGVAVSADAGHQDERCDEEAAALARLARPLC